MGEMNKRLLVSCGLLRCTCTVKGVLEKFSLNFEIIKIEDCHFDKGSSKKAC